MPRLVRIPGRRWWWPFGRRPDRYEPRFAVGELPSIEDRNRELINDWILHACPPGICALDQIQGES
jgi:hypothetical protein